MRIAAQALRPHERSDRQVEQQRAHAESQPSHPVQRPGLQLPLRLLTSAPVPRWLLIIPLAWSLVGGSAAFMLGVPQDWPLLFSGLTIVLLVLWTLMLIVWYHLGIPLGPA